MNSVDVNNDRALAYSLLRFALGVNITFHGIGRIYSGTAAFAQTLIPMFAKTPLPSWSVHAFGLCLPWAEFLIGLLVLFGAFSRAAYVIGILEIAVLTFGSTLLQQWVPAGLQLTYALIYVILLAFREYNVISVDGLLGKSSSTAANPGPS